MRLKKILPLIFLLVIWLIFSSPFLLKNLLPAPLDFLVGFFNPWQPFFKIPIRNNALPDVVTQILPLKLYNLEQITNGQIPLWNPFNFAGTPHMANIQSAVFYPLNLLFYLLPFHVGYGFFILLQPLLAGLFTYLFCRKIRLTPQASLLASLSFMFSGFVTSWLEYGTLVHAFLWLPLCLYLIEKLKDQHRFSLWHFVMILTLSLSFLSGHLQISLYLYFISFCYYFVSLIKTKKTELKSLINLVIVFLAPLLLISFQLLPSLKLYFLSLRSQAVSSDWYHYFQTPPNHLITLLAPDFFGNPVTRNFWSKSSYVEMNGYIGLLPLIMASYAFWRAKRFRFFKIISLTSLILALPTPLSELILTFKIPIFSTSSPSRVFCLFCFSTAILSGAGLDYFKREFKNQKLSEFFRLLKVYFFLFLILWLWTFFSKNSPQDLRITQKNFLLPTLILTAFCLTSLIFKNTFLQLKTKFKIQILIFTILLLTSLELFRFSFKFTSYTDSAFFFPNLGIIKFVQENQGINRTLALFDAQQNLPFNVFSPEGYDPLSIKRYQELISTAKDGKISLSERTAGEKIERRGKFSKRLIDILGVKYVVQGQSDIFAFPTWEYPESFQKVYEDKNFYVFENKKLPPRFFLTNNIKILKTDQEIINTLLDDSFNPQESIILEGKPEIELQKNQLLSSVKLLEYKPNRISFETTSNENAMFYLSDSFYPEWEATLDGRKIKTFRANYTFRAIEAPSGNHVIEFRYNPQDFLFGLKLSLVTVFLLILPLFVNFVKKIKILILPFDVYIRHKIVSSFFDRGESILDVGGGLDQLKKFASNQITTADIQNADIITRGDKLPFKTSQFDIVTSIDTLEHIPQKQRRIFINELIRVAKKKLILAAPLGTEKHQIYEKDLLKKLGQSSPDYLKEHVKYYLPTLDQIQKFFPNQKKDLFFSGNFYLSEKLLRFHLFETKNKFLNKTLYYFKFIFNLVLNIFLFPVLKKRKYCQSINRFYIVIKK